MDFIITFFRDILDGPLYIVVAIICGILICSCIGYLGEQYLNKQKEKKEFDDTHAVVAPQSLGTDTVVNTQVVPQTVSAQTVNSVTTNQGQ